MPDPLQVDERRFRIARHQRIPGSPDPPHVVGGSTLEFGEEVEVVPASVVAARDEEIAHLKAHIEERERVTDAEVAHLSDRIEEMEARSGVALSLGAQEVGEARDEASAQVAALRDALREIGEAKTLEEVRGVVTNGPLATAPGGSREDECFRLREQVGAFEDSLWRCVELSGADTSDGRPSWPDLGTVAVQEVERLREQYREVCAEVDAVHARGRVADDEAQAQVAALTEEVERHEARNADLHRRVRARLDRLGREEYSAAELVADLERLARHPVWEQSEQATVDLERQAGQFATTKRILQERLEVARAEGATAQAEVARLSARLADSRAAHGGDLDCVPDAIVDARAEGARQERKRLDGLLREWLESLPVEPHRGTLRDSLDVVLRTGELPPPECTCDRAYKPGCPEACPRAAVLPPEDGGS